MSAVLSPRESEVAGFVARGLRNKEIAAELGLQECTVKRHVSTALRKTGARNRVALAAWLKNQDAKAEEN